MLESTFKIRQECLRNLKISTLLLKRGAARGLTLAQIGQILCRPDEDDSQASLLERIVQKASLCASLKEKMQTQIKDSLLFMIDEEESPLSKIPKSASGLNLHSPNKNFL